MLPELPAPLISELEAPATTDLAELLNQPWTLDDLAAKEKENENRKSLKQIILDMQD